MTARLHLILLFAVVSVAYSQVGFLDRFRSKPCADFMDCGEGECCVFSGANLWGKRDVGDGSVPSGVVTGGNPMGSLPGGNPSGDVAPGGNPNGGVAPGGDPTGGVNPGGDPTGVDPGTTGGDGGVTPDSEDLAITEMLKKLEQLRADMEKFQNPFKGHGEHMAKIHGQDGKGIKWFLDAMGKQGAPKTGTCRKLGSLGSSCINRLNAHVCPCGDGFMCKEDKSATWSGFGAIKGLHNMRCMALPKDL